MLRLISPLLAVAVFATASFAESTEKVCAADCCPIAKAMEKLPQLAFRVGEKDICCPDAAAKLAKEQSTQVKFVVAKKAYDDKADATYALAKVTEKLVAEFTSTSTCKETGKFFVAGKEHCCSVMAGETAKLVETAVKKVKLTYTVGGEKCDCPLNADTLAKENGKERMFVVGDTKTSCSVTARLNLARAKYKAAVEAIVATDRPEDAKS